APAALDLGQGRELLESPQTAHCRREKIEQQRGGILIVEQLAVARAVPHCGSAVQPLQELADQADVLEALHDRGPSGPRGRRCHTRLLAPLGLRRPLYVTGSACTNFVPNTIGGKVRKGGSGWLPHCRTPPHPVP